MKLTDTAFTYPNLRLPETRYIASNADAPYWAPPYQSLLENVRQQNRLFLRDEHMRNIALHPVKLHAGQAPLPNGELGRFATPFLMPEMLGGIILQTNV